MENASGSAITEADRRHWNFIKTLLCISKELSKEETADLKLYCSHVIPGGKLEKMERAVDVFIALQKCDKIGPENIQFVEEILKLVGRSDIITNHLHMHQPPDRVIPEDPHLQPGTSSGRRDEGEESLWLRVRGHTRMEQETVDRHRNNLAIICRTCKRRIKYRAHKKDKSILVHFDVPKETTALLQLLARNADPRLMFMGVYSLQIGTGTPIDVSTEELTYLDAETEIAARGLQSIDDSQLVCKSATRQQVSSRCWSSLAALNLFSDTLPLLLQAVESLEYQGFSYSLIRSLAERNQMREQQMRQIVKRREADEHTFMTMRSRLVLSENRARELEEYIPILERQIQQAQEDKEHVEKIAAARMLEYTGEKPGFRQEQIAGIETPPAQATVGMEKETGFGDITTISYKEFAQHAEASSDTKDTDHSAVKGTSGKEQPEAKGGEDSGKEKAGLSSSEAESLTPGLIVFGGKGSEAGKFDPPCGVVVSSSNEIFVTDYYNRRVQVHNIQGVHLRQFPTTVPGTEGSAAIMPNDISFDRNGQLLVIGTYLSDNFVVRYDENGKPQASFKLKYTGWYRGISTSALSDHIIVTERKGDYGDVQVLQQDGTPVRRFGRQQELVYPVYVAADKDGKYLVLDWVTHSVYVYDGTGHFLFKFGGLGSGDGQLKGPRSLCIDDTGNIIVADGENGRVEMYTNRGKHVRHIVKDMGKPLGTAVGPQGHLVVTDRHDSTVTILSSY